MATKLSVFVLAGSTRFFHMQHPIYREIILPLVNFNLGEITLRLDSQIKRFHYFFQFLLKEGSGTHAGLSSTGCRSGISVNLKPKNFLVDIELFGESTPLRNEGRLLADNIIGIRTHFEFTSIFKKYPKITTKQTSEVVFSEVKNSLPDVSSSLFDIVEFAQANADILCVFGLGFFL